MHYMSVPFNFTLVLPELLFVFILASISIILMTQFLLASVETFNKVTADFIKHSKVLEGKYRSSSSEYIRGYYFGFYCGARKCDITAHSAEFKRGFQDGAAESSAASADSRLIQSNLNEADSRLFWTRTFAPILACFVAIALYTFATLFLEIEKNAQKADDEVL